MNDKIKFIKFIKLFKKYTRNRTVGKYRLFIFNGYNNHATPEFDRFYTEYLIILLYILFYLL